MTAALSRLRHDGAEAECVAGGDCDVYSEIWRSYVTLCVGGNAGGGPGHDSRCSGTAIRLASLKADTRDLLLLPPTANSGPGEIRLVHVPLTNLILRGYPLPMPPIEIINLPGWAKDTFDFVAKAAPGATPEQQQQMFRAFLADRLKLTAHYESKDQKGYNLVFAHADHKLGLGLKPTTLDCTQASGRPVPGRDRDIVAFAATHCGLAMTDFDGTMTS